MENNKKPSWKERLSCWTTQDLMSLALFFQCMENVVRGSQSFLTNAIDSLTIVAKGYPSYAALMDSLLDGLPAEKKEDTTCSKTD